jgi:hypothetical protein
MSTPVKAPLSPSLLKEMGLTQDIPSLKPDFNAAGNWNADYLIWACHGYYEMSNFNCGALKINRKTGEKGNISLEIDQHIVVKGGIVNHIKAQGRCLDDAVCSPVKWSLESRFTDPKGNWVPTLTSKVSVMRENGNLACELNQNKYNIKINKNLTFDWCLFEAIQRLHLNTKWQLVFDMMEGLLSYRKDQRIYKIERPYQGLKGYYQAGQGVLPREYWVDQHHRLIMVIAFNRAYVMHHRAEEIFDKEVADMRS